MTKILVSSDWHLDSDPANEYRFEIFDVISDEMEKHEPDAVVIAGDLTDRKDRHSAKLVDRIVGGLESLTYFGSEVFILRGNHDCEDPKVPFFKFLDKMEGINFIVEPESFVIGESEVLFLPHSRQPEKEWSDLGLEEETGLDYIFLHQTFKGARGENGRKLDGASYELFGQLDALCVSGDIHVPQRIGPITYCGAPYPVRFGDSFQPRLLLLDGDKKKSIKLDIMRKHSLVINDPEELLDMDLREGDQAKVELRLPKADLMDWEDYRQSVQEICDEAGIELFEIKLTQAEEDEREEMDHEPSSMSYEEILDECCDRWETPDDVREVGRDLLKEAL